MNESIEICYRMTVDNTHAGKNPWIAINCTAPLDHTIFICEVNKSNPLLPENILSQPSHRSCFPPVIHRICHAKWTYFLSLYNLYPDIYLRMVYNLNSSSSIKCEDIGGKPASYDYYNSIYNYHSSHLRKWLGHNDQLFLTYDYAKAQCVKYHWSHVDWQWQSHRFNCTEDTKSVYVGNILCEHNPYFIPSENCLSDLHQCKDSTCILKQHLCDGHVDCPGGDDEEDCQICYFSNLHLHANINYCLKKCHVSNCMCTDHYFQCQTGGCVSFAKICDCHRDCPDGSDEMCMESICSSRKCHLIQSLPWAPPMKLRNMKVYITYMGITETLLECPLNTQGLHCIHLLIIRKFQAFQIWMAYQI